MRDIVLGSAFVTTIQKDAFGGALTLIADERARQVSVEGWTHSHDDDHASSELAMAAAAYAIDDEERGRTVSPRLHFWPFDVRDFKPTPKDRIRELVKAGALIVAEIERLQRASLNVENGAG